MSCCLSSGVAIAPGRMGEGEGKEERNRKQEVVKEGSEGGQRRRKVSEGGMPGSGTGEG